ncbi:hypothetical protein ACVDFE_35010 [Lentzea chajnantorensis]
MSTIPCRDRRRRITAGANAATACAPGFCGSSSSRYVASASRACTSRRRTPPTSSRHSTAAVTSPASFLICTTCWGLATRPGSTMSSSTFSPSAVSAWWRVSRPVSSSKRITAGTVAR